MVKDTRRRQKKLERRKAKAKAKKKALARQESRGMAARLEEAAEAPILHCYTTDILWDEGLSPVLISRKLKSGHVAFVIFLVDVYCLGVKDVTLGVAPRSRYDFQVYGKLSEQYRLVGLTPEAARKLVEGAVEYARDLGLPPHPDYRKAGPIFGDIDAEACREEFVYGQDGKPCFFAGPYDSPWRCKQIIRTLTDRCGPDGFHYLMPLEAMGELPSGGRVLRIDDDADFEFDE
jgi:hypothetical protein